MKRILALILLAALPACGRRIEAPTPAATAKSYPLAGVVRKVEADEGRVTIAHEDIPGLMRAMTMTFRVKDKTSLEGVREGDKVAATLKVHGAERSELENLAVTELAPPAELTLDMGSMALRPRLSRLEPGQEVPDFALTDQDGQALKLSDLRGKVVVLTFIYTSCTLPEFCPAMDAKFAELARIFASRGDEVRLVSASFDPEHDTPEVLRAHAKLRGAKPPLWRFAVASHDELRRVAEPLGLTYGPRPNEIMHNLTTAVIGPDGRLARLESGSSWTPEALSQAVRKALARPR